MPEDDWEGWWREWIAQGRKRGGRMLPCCRRRGRWCGPPVPHADIWSPAVDVVLAPGGWLKEDCDGVQGSQPR